jgi:hypothetical protein
MLGELNMEMRRWMIVPIEDDANSIDDRHCWHLAQPSVPNPTASIRKCPGTRKLGALSLELRGKSLTTRPTPSQLQQKPLGVLEAFPDAHQEGHRLLAVDDAVVVAQGEVHHGPRHDLAIADNGPLLDAVHAKDT